MPVTATRVSELSAAASCNAAELQTRQAARRNAFRRTSGLTARVYAATLLVNASAPPCDGWRMYGASRTSAASRPTATTPAVTRELFEERPRRAHLRPGRPAVRRRRPGMGRHDVPEQDVVLDPSSRRTRCTIVARRLCRPAAGQLAFRGERHAADPRAAVAGGLADEHDARVARSSRYSAQPLAAQLGASVLVVRRSDACAREPLYDLVYGRKARSSGTIEVGVSKNGPAPSGSIDRRAVAREERRDLLLRLRSRTALPAR